MSRFSNNNGYDKIPEDHACSKCGLGKHHRGFALVKGLYVKKMCNTCINIENRPDVCRRVCAKLSDRATNTRDIKTNIDNYFKETR